VENSQDLAVLEDMFGCKFMKVLRLIAFFSVVIFLGACGLSQTREESVATSSYRLLQNQQVLLTDHAASLQSLSASQSSLASQIAQLQTELMAVREEMADLSVEDVTVETASSKSEPVANKIAATDQQTTQGKAILGRVEYVWLKGFPEFMKARIDTGAKSSSLHARNIQPFERNGDRWVKFVVDSEGEAMTLEAPLVRYVRIRQASVEGLDRRPVIQLSINLGELQEDTEFTLTDRADMIYPVLLGRSFLQDIAVVDVGKKFTRSKDPKLTAQISRQ